MGIIRLKYLLPINHEEGPAHCRVQEQETMMVSWCNNQNLMLVGPLVSGLMTEDFSVGDSSTTEGVDQCT